MSQNYYSEIHLHLIWHTKESFPLLIPEVETVVYKDIQQRLIRNAAAFSSMKSAGPRLDLHVCLTVPPTLLISEMIGTLKGGSSHEVNQPLGRGRKPFQWQAGYGV